MSTLQAQISPLQEQMSTLQEGFSRQQGQVDSLAQDLVERRENALIRGPPRPAQHMRAGR